MLKRFIDEKINVKTLSPLALAFVGDCVYEMFVREKLVCVKNCPANKLHKKSVEKVCCQAQAVVVEKILSILTEDELAIFKRGRNAHTNNIPKNATCEEYHKATGLEALVGYLYLTGETSRLQQIFSAI